MIESHYDTAFTAKLAQREKQIQQHYRPVIGVHKWFARRPGALFRSLILSEFSSEKPLREAYFESNDLSGITIGDPFMGGGTPLFEANRVGANVAGFDVNPMSRWVVQQELSGLDVDRFRIAANEVINKTEEKIGDLYKTTCTQCGDPADVKYFLWVKTTECKECGHTIRLFNNYRVAKNERHPNHVIVCASCDTLNEVALKEEVESTDCRECGSGLEYDGPARRRYCNCPECGIENDPRQDEGLPNHHLYAIEYHCPDCYADVDGRMFKAPDENDLDLLENAKARLKATDDTPIPNDSIPEGDESSRLRRWGYERYRELFNPRQLFSLATLKKVIEAVEDRPIRAALATVFSDILRYQNMVCRYDNWALKIQDIFSIHGFPVSLQQCENSVLGAPGGGSGGFRHFVEKYATAKEYCTEPYEYTAPADSKKQKVYQAGERISATFVDGPDDLRTSTSRGAWLEAASADEVNLEDTAFDAVLTDPPYYANVQYAELIDFCYVWMKDLIEVREAGRSSTRHPKELTVNETEGRGIISFTRGLSSAYSTFAGSLKPGAPFAFTYHHNDVEAYLPVIVAVLDANLVCTSVLACPAEMGASQHIEGTGSSVVDSIFVCRRSGSVDPDKFELKASVAAEALKEDLRLLDQGRLKPSKGDARCVFLGHLARLLIWHLHRDWDRTASFENKIESVRNALTATLSVSEIDPTVETAYSAYSSKTNGGPLFEQVNGNGESTRLTFDLAS